MNIYRYYNLRGYPSLKFTKLLRNNVIEIFVFQNRYQVELIVRLVSLRNFVYVSCKRRQKNKTEKILPQRNTKRAEISSTHDFFGSIGRCSSLRTVLFLDRAQVRRRLSDFTVIEAKQTDAIAKIVASVYRLVSANCLYL